MSGKDSNKYSYTRDELIREVENETEVGKKIVEIYMSYLRSFKKDVMKE